MDTGFDPREARKRVHIDTKVDADATTTVPSECTGGKMDHHRCCSGASFTFLAHTHTELPFLLSSFRRSRRIVHFVCAFRSSQSRSSSSANRCTYRERETGGRASHRIAAGRGTFDVRGAHQFDGITVPDVCVCVELVSYGAPTGIHYNYLYDDHPAVVASNSSRSPNTTRYTVAVV